MVTVYLDIREMIIYDKINHKRVVNFDNYHYTEVSIVFQSHSLIVPAMLGTNKVFANIEIMACRSQLLIYRYGRTATMIKEYIKGYSTVAWDIACKQSPHIHSLTLSADASRLAPYIWSALCNIFKAAVSDCCSSQVLCLHLSTFPAKTTPAFTSCHGSLPSLLLRLILVFYYVKQIQNG